VTVDDIERLSAYLDGQLSEDDVRDLEARLANEPELAKQLEAFRNVDSALRAPFDRLLSEPIPDRFLQLLGGSDDEVAAPPAAVTSAAEIIDFADAKAKRVRTPVPSLWASWPVRGALAASFVAGLVAITQLQPGAWAEKGIETALNEAPSGTAVRLASGETLKPRLSFAAKDGRFCREFDLSGQTGIACRKADGWTIEAKVKSDAPAAAGAEQGFATASGAGSALDPVYDRLGAGEPLDPAREKALIKSGWK
jgi:negative regulator of sigma E activity